MMCKLHEQMQVYNDQCLTGWLAGWLAGLMAHLLVMAQTQHGSFLDTVDIISVKLCTMIALVELFLLIERSVTLTLFQGHSRTCKLYSWVRAYLPQI